MLLFAVVLPATFVLIGMFAMTILEPVPEFGGYDHEWSRTVRSVISVLLIVVGFKCAGIHKQAVRSTMNSPAVGSDSVCRLVQSVLIAFLVFFLSSVVSSLLISENRFGGGIDIL